MKQLFHVDYNVQVSALAEILIDIGVLKLQLDPYSVRKIHLFCAIYALL